MLYKCPSWLSSHLLQNEISICKDGQHNQNVSWQAFPMSQHKAELKQCTQKMQWQGCELGNSILLRRVVSLSQTNPHPGHWSSLSCSVTHCSSNPRGTLQAACSQCSLSLALQLPLPAPWEGHTPLQLLQGCILAVYSQRLTQWFSPGGHHLAQVPAQSRANNEFRPGSSRLSKLLTSSLGSCSVWHRTWQATRQKVSRISALFATTHWMHCNSLL